VLLLHLITLDNTYTLGRTSLDVGSAGSRDQFVFAAVLLKMWRHRTFRILVQFSKLPCYLSQDYDSCSTKELVCRIYTVLPSEN